jgi:hypothetical protein
MWQTCAILVFFPINGFVSVALTLFFWSPGCKVISNFFPHIMATLTPFFQKILYICLLTFLFSSPGCKNLPQTKTLVALSQICLIFCAIFYLWGMFASINPNPWR